MFVSRMKWVWLVVIALGAMLFVACTNSSAKRGTEQPGRGQSATITGEGECRTSTLDADGLSDAPVVEAAVDAQHPITGYVLRTPDILWWNVNGSFQGQGRVDFVALEGTGGFELIAEPDRKIRIGNIDPSTPPASTLLHITSFQLTWRVTTTPATNPPPSIGVRVRISPFQDGQSNRCLVYVCDPETGPQTCSPSPAGTLCSDGNACNGLETCDGEGACGAGTNLPSGEACSDGNACNGIEHCDGVGNCAAGVNVPNGTSCSDGNPCNGAETCETGTCIPGAPLTSAEVDDHNECTVDSCDPTRGGIVNDPIAGCQSNAGAPPLDSTVAPGFGASTEFLYAGANPVQTGVASGVINPDRVAVIRGRVFTSPSPVSTTKTPAAGATVTILGHPEYGSTHTRQDGYFDLAVNGGGSLVVNIAAVGVLPMQRRASAMPRDWTILGDVVLTAPETSADTFTPGLATAQLVRGQTTPAGVDGDPARRAIVYFPPNTTFENFTPPAGPLAIEITEYTRANGQERMPGELPPTSGYTYAVEVSVPAARQAGIDDVEFNHDVVLYVNNFTGYPVGTTVPLGYYDRTKGAWLAEKSGRIIKIIGVTGGLADLDVTGDGIADTGAALTALGIGDTERASLSNEYAVDTELWRSAVRHFSPWDCNWAFGPPPDAVAPPPPAPQDQNPPDACTRAGSIIGCESRTLGEQIPIVGTPFNLHYQSQRNPGFQDKVTFRVTDDRPLPPDTFLGVRIEIWAAGRPFRYFWPAPIRPNSFITWTWDGLDAYGRYVGTGTHIASINVGYEFSGSTTSATPIFGALGDVLITGERVARTITLWRSVRYPIAHFDAKPLGFGGWTIDANHVAEIDGMSLYRGDGTRWKFGAEDTGSIVETFAGNGSTAATYNDGADARLGPLGRVEGLATAPDGSVVFAANGYLSSGGRIRRVAPDRIITTVAGLPPTVPKVDGALALHAEVFPTSVAVGADGTIFFAEANKHQVWKIVPGPTPTIHLVAGTGLTTEAQACPPPVNCGDGGDAKDAELWTPSDLAVAPDGTVFIADSAHWRIRRVGPEGKISSYYVNALNSPRRLSVREDGALFALVENNAVIRIEPTGITQTYLKPNTSNPINFFADWCQAAGDAGGFLVARPDDSFVMPCYNKVVVRTPSGTNSRIAGQQNAYETGFSGDGGPALRALFSHVSRLAVDDRDLLVADLNNWRIRRIRPTQLSRPSLTTFWVPGEAGNEVYEVELDGRHLRTLSALKGTPLYTFGYHPTSRQLTSITDASNNVTTIGRTPAGITITAPHGQVTTLALDGNGYLANVTTPNGEITHLAHTSSGLLTDLVDARGHAHHFEYRADGRLMKDVNASPGSPGTRLATVADANGWAVDITSAEGRVTRHRIDTEGDFGDTAVRERRTITQGGSLTSVIDTYVDGSKSSVHPDGTKLSVLSTAADPRWGVTAAFANLVRVDVGYPTTTHSMTRTQSRTATLATPGDPFSVSGQTISTLRSGSGLPTAVTTHVFAAGPPATWTTTSPVGVQVRETLDALERVTDVEVLGSSPVALHPLHYDYDARGRVQTVTWGSRVYTRMYHPTTGWVTSTTAPEGLGVSYDQRDANGRPTQMTLPGGRQLEMSYDPAGNVVSVTPPGQPAHGFAFDPNDRLASYVPPNGVPAFTPKDTVYTRDFDGLPVGALHPEKPVSSEYDALGMLVRSTVAGVATTYGRDPQGRLRTITTSDGVTLTNSYDGSLLTSQEVSGPFGHVLNKSYDNFFRVSRWNIDGPADASNAVSVIYYADDLVQQIGGMTVTRSVGNNGNGLLTGTSLGNIADSYDFNGYGEITGHHVTGSATAYDAAYVRDDAGRIHIKTETIGGATHSYRYEYDAAGRLWQVFVDGAAAPTREWTYGPNGNRSDGTYDGQDRLRSGGGVSYAYGKNGELEARTDINGTVGYSYDALGNLRAVTRPAPQLPSSITYVIDGQSRRIGVRHGGVLVRGFLYDGPRIIAELDGAGNVVSRFVYATSGHSPDVMFRGGNTYRIVKDHLGSPRLVVNASTGAVAQALDYDEWGNATEAGTSGFQPFGFAGGLWDRDTGLVRFGARDYDPTTGRWTTKDASRFGGGLNFYAYANNDPVNLVDTTGRWPHESWELKGQAANGGYGRSDAAAELKAFFVGLLAARLPYVFFGGIAVSSERELPLLGLGGNPVGGMCGGAAAEEVSSFGPASVGAGQRTPLTLQRGGNTIRGSTADGLNEYAGTNLSRRDWGRALEGLKGDLGLPANHHGIIMDNGHYLDSQGNYLGNILDYL